MTGPSLAVMRRGLFVRQNVTRRCPNLSTQTIADIFLVKSYSKFLACNGCVNKILFSPMSLFFVDNSKLFADGSIENRFG